MSSHSVIIPEVEAYLDQLPACQTNNDRERLRLVYNKRFKAQNPSRYKQILSDQNIDVSGGDDKLGPMPVKDWNVF